MDAVNDKIGSEGVEVTTAKIAEEDNQEVLNHTTPKQATTAEAQVTLSNTAD